MKECDK